MANSDSDSDCFESADENFSEDEIENRTKSSEVVKISGNVETPNTAVHNSDDEQASRISKESSQELDDEILPESNQQAKHFRTRPQRGKKSLIKNVKKDITPQRLPLGDFIKPDALIQDLTGQISKNLSFGLSTVKQTSYSLKDMVTSSLPLTTAAVEPIKDIVKSSLLPQPAESQEIFVYDDDRNEPLSVTPEDIVRESSPLKTSLNDMILSLSQEFGMLQAVTDSISSKKQGDESDREADDECGWENFDTEEKLDEHFDTEEKLDEHFDTEEKLDEHFDTEEKLDEHFDTEEKLDKHFDTEEKLDEHFDTDTEEKVKKHFDTKEKVEEHFNTKEKVLEHFDTEEKVVEHFDTEEVEEQFDVTNKHFNTNEEKLRLGVSKKDIVCKKMVKNCLNNENISQTNPTFEEKFALSDELALKMEGIQILCVKEELEVETKKKVAMQNIDEDVTEKLPVNCQLKTEKEHVQQEAGWGDWGIDEIEEEIKPNQEIRKLIENKAEEESETKPAVNTKVPQIPEETGGWGDFNFKDTPASMNTDDNGGWDDFDMDDDEIFLATEVKTEKPRNDCKTTKGKTKEDREVKNEVVKDDLDSWGDWGDEEAVPAASEPKKKEWSGWENFGQPQEKQEQGWGGWGVNSLLTRASAVTQGLSSVLEAGLGVPDPAELARIHESERRLAKKEKASPPNQTMEEAGKLFPIFDIVAGVSSKITDNSLVQGIGSKVLSGGLDTLESIGKKTMQVLQDGDPGLKKKKALLLGESGKPVLSQILREAKQKAEVANQKLEAKQVARQCHFETLFDDFQGLVHLEALEMLSRQCELRLQQIKSSMTPSEIEDFMAVVEEVKELCEIDEEEFETEAESMGDFKGALTDVMEPLKDEIIVEKLLEVHNRVEKLTVSEMGSQLVYQQAMASLAELTAAATQQFHKIGELLLVKQRRKTVEEADTLLKFAGILCYEINQVSKKFTKELTQTDAVRHAVMVTNIDVEAGNACSYIKQALALLVPLIQLGATS